MGRTKNIVLSDEQRVALENGYRYGSAHRFRMRCKAVLMKADGIKTSEIANFVGYTDLVVYKWLRKFESGGVEELREKGGRGPKPLMRESDTASVKEAVRQHRMSIKTAKAAWEKATERQVSEATFRRFLELLAQDISV